MVRIGMKNRSVRSLKLTSITHIKFQYPVLLTHQQDAFLGIILLFNLGFK